MILVGAIAAWPDISRAAELLIAGKKIYVSTIGLPFYPKEGHEAMKDFVMYRIDSSAKGNRQLDWLIKIIEPAARNQKQFDLLVQVLSARKYEKECVYLVFSPILKGMKIDQPYRYAKDHKLFFDAVAEPKLNDQDYIYLRIYVVDKKDDNLKKFLVYAGKQQELISREQ